MARFGPHVSEARRVPDSDCLGKTGKTPQGLFLASVAPRLPGARPGRAAGAVPRVRPPPIRGQPTRSACPAAAATPCRVTGGQQGAPA